MIVKDKRFLIVGMARSGQAAARFLIGRGAKVTLNDSKPLSSFGKALEGLVSAGCTDGMAKDPAELLDGIEYVVISPGVPIDSPFIIKAKEKGIEVLGEVELAARFCSATIVAITGTNGKTTTTALTGRIFSDAGKRTHVVGNIGEPFIAAVESIKPEDTVVAEISSFQLESTHTFHPKAAALLNITQDHLNRHGTMQVYAQTKLRIFEGQQREDWAVINFDDPLTRSLAERLTSRVVYFSRKETLTEGIFVDTDGVITLAVDNRKIKVCTAKDVRIPGPHNLENALAASALALLCGIPAESVSSTLRTFEGVEHRLEPVREFKGVTFINDSKGTNPDASIKAVQSMEKPTVLIAGGYDKDSDFASLIKAFTPQIVHMVVLGATAEKIISAANECGFTSYSRAETFEEAVRKAFELAPEGGVVLLSPACASFDMFKDYEERGRVFKSIVNAF